MGQEEHTLYCPESRVCVNSANNCRYVESNAVNVFSGNTKTYQVDFVMLATVGFIMIVLT